MPTVDISVDQHGKIVSTIDGGPPVVARGDTVTWKSSQGELIVTFDGDMPFGGVQQFKGAQGQPTQPSAVVRHDAPTGHFACTVTLKGKTQTGVTGVDIRP